MNAYEFSCFLSFFFVHIYNTVTKHFVVILDEREQGVTKERRSKKAQRVLLNSEIFVLLSSSLHVLSTLIVRVVRVKLCNIYTLNVRE